MHKMPLLGLVAALVSGLALTSYTVQVRAQSPTKTPAKKQRRVNVSSETYEDKPTPQGTIRTLLGTVVIKSEDTTLTTDKAVYNVDTGVASSPGKLRLNDDYNTLTATTGVAYYKTRDARFRGNVVIVARPRPENLKAPEGSARRRFDAPATITSDKVDYNWRTRIAQIPVPLTLKQKDMTVVADRGSYDARQEIAVFENNVRYTKTNGDTGRASKVVVVLKEGAESFKATGNVVTEFQFEDEDEAPATPPTGTTPRPTPRPSTPRPSTPPANPQTPPPSETPSPAPESPTPQGESGTP